MMNDFKNKIEKATSIRSLEKVRKQALEVYGLYSKQFGEILDLCWEKAKTLKH